MRAELRREARLVAAALQMLTRLPVPQGPLQADWLARSAKYFPFVGIVVGAIAAGTFALAGELWPTPMPALLAVGATLLVTGALHEDGLADAVDGLGGRTREARLAIMKDPRLGAFGALALGLTLALKVAALAALTPGQAAPALIAAAAVARVWPAVIMSRLPYAADRALSKIDHGIEGPRPGEAALALALAVVTLAFMPVQTALAALAAGALVAAAVAALICRGLGGYTGDVLGAVIAASETAFLLGVVAASRT